MIQKGKKNNKNLFYKAGVSIYHLAAPAIAIILPCLRKGANLHKIRALNFARILTIIPVPMSKL